MEVKFSPQLDAMASVMKYLYPHKNVVVLRLLVDYKTPNGIDRNMDTLANVPRGTTTAQLIERVRADLPNGCTLSAISSVDYGRPVYIAPGFLEETIREQGKSVPDDLEVAMKNCGLELLTLEKVFEKENNQ